MKVVCESVSPLESISPQIQLTVRNDVWCKSDNKFQSQSTGYVYEDNVPFTHEGIQAVVDIRPALDAWKRECPYRMSTTRPSAIPAQNPCKHTFRIKCALSGRLIHLQRLHSLPQPLHFLHRQGRPHTNLQWKLPNLHTKTENAQTSHVILFLKTALSFAFIDKISCVSSGVTDSDWRCPAAESSSG